MDAKGGHAGARGSWLPLRRGDSDSMKPRSSGRANNLCMSDSCCSPATLLNNTLILCTLTLPSACCGLTRAYGSVTGSPESVGKKVDSRQNDLSFRFQKSVGISIGAPMHTCSPAELVKGPPVSYTRLTQINLANIEKP